MFARSVEDALNELAEASVITSNQACLERCSTALLRDPGDGDSLVRALGGAEQGQGAVDDMLQILTATLDGARMRAPFKANVGSVVARPVAIA